MLICHCRVVDDRTIRAAVLGGAGCPDEVASRCGAGSRCGGCRPAVLELIAEAAVPADDGRIFAA